MDAIAAAVLSVPEVALLDRESDPDHNRSVLTFAGPPEAVGAAAFRAVEAAVSLIDLTRHRGAHPRIGAADVVPFIPIEGVAFAECVQLSERVGREIWDKLRVPVYLYEGTARKPERVNLENIRRGQFEALVQEMGRAPERDPDIGEPTLHPTAGAVVVGARKFLIAYNVNLGTPDLEIARKIAKTIRFSSGGLRYVKAMGVMLVSRNLAQVSMNLTDFEQTPMHVVFEAVRREAERYGVPVVGSEIVGLVPKKAIEMSAAYFLQCENFRPELVLENRLAEALAVAGWFGRVSRRAGGPVHSGRRQRLRGRGGDGSGPRRHGDAPDQAGSCRVRRRSAVFHRSSGSRRRSISESDRGGSAAECRRSVTRRCRGSVAGARTGRGHGGEAECFGGSR